MTMALFTLSSWILALLASPMLAQAPDAWAPAGGVEIRPSGIRTGDVFQLRVRIRVPAGFRLIPPDSLPSSEMLNPAGIATIRQPGAGEETAGDGLVEVVYPLQALRPGKVTLPPLRVRLDPDGAMTETEEPGDTGAVAGEARWGWLELGAATVGSVLPEGGGDLETAGPIHLREAPEGRRMAGILALIGILGSGMTGLLLRRPSGYALPGAAEGDPEPVVDVAPLPPDVARRRLTALLEEVDSGHSGVEVQWQEAIHLFRDLVLTRAGLERRSATSREILAAGAWRDNPGGEALRVILEAGDAMRFGQGPVSGRTATDHLGRIKNFLEADLV